MDVAETIVNAAGRYGVDPALALEVAAAESSLDPDTPDSAAGAIGLFQLMPTTAAELGVNPRDPAQNIDGGVRYLRNMLSEFPDVAAALGAYDWGPKRVAEALAKWGADWLSHAPGETQGYVLKILSNLGTEYTVSPPQTAPQDSTGIPGARGVQPPPAARAGMSWGILLFLAAAGLFVLWAAEEAWSS